MGRNYLAHTQGDAINAILAAAGYNFSLLLRWLKTFLWLLIAAFLNLPKQLVAREESRFFRPRACVPRCSVTGLRPGSAIRVRIPMKPATDSDLKPASHSDFIPAGVPI
ncbi:MAG: hypothetical protein J0I79_28000 [Mesorhizobium sp.]|uniref:hypothetical protein n=1 Tax=Mesorhizobium sp. TaxID=1871066 RepID=UPI001AD26191|nr:hypothetical protein [Mesorhizobium sp.]MBN9221804.1 hypothetical protein [Mesorhizobium sp.]